MGKKGVDKETGELLPNAPGLIIRHAWLSDEWVEPKTVYPPSIVDSSQYTSVEELMARFLRGDATVAFTPVYEVEPGADPAKAVDEMPLHRTDGFDMADASEAIRRGVDAALDLNAKAVDDKAKADLKAKADKEAAEKQLKDAEAAKPKASPAGNAGESVKP